MSNAIISILSEIRRFAIDNSVTATFFYHEEDSYLMRFANSAISLNTNEHLLRLEITAYEGNKRASYEMITSLTRLDEMKQGVMVAAEMVKHAQPLNYQPTIPTYRDTIIDECGFEPDLSGISNAEKLAFFNEAVQGLESEKIKLGGIFSCGKNVTAQINTNSEHAQIFVSSDAQITIVLSHSDLKWEVIAEQSAQKKSDLDPISLNRDLKFLLEHYQNDTPQQIPLGHYDVVFGPAATAELVDVMNWIGFDGGMMKRGFSFLTEEHVGKRILGDKFTLTDDPSHPGTFPFSWDMMGIERKPYIIFERGRFKSFTWNQDDADEFNAAPTGHTVMHKSLVVTGGDKPVNTLEELVNLPRENDVLYIPYIHYMNIVNPSKGLITGSSRFGALLLKQDGSVVVPYNVRITQSLLDIFGKKVEWMTANQTVYNTSSSYGARNPTALVVPTFIYVKDLEISHSNSTY
jgi:PmbA protein